jgi:hypothetical protein
LIEMQKEFLRYQIHNSPQLAILPQFRQELRNLTVIELRRKRIRSNRLLVDLLLEVFRHLTAELLTDMMDKDETKKTPVSELCLRLLTYSTHKDDDGELMTAAQNIEDMEREHLPWRYTTRDCSSPRCEFSPTPSPSSPPADEIRLSPEPVSLPSPAVDTPLKGSGRQRVTFEKCLPTRAPGT